MREERRIWMGAGTAVLATTASFAGQVKTDYDRTRGPDDDDLRVGE